MKRLLVVLFGVLVFQGNAQSETCFKEYTDDVDGGMRTATAEVLTPTSDDSSILNKAAAFLFQWKDREEILGDKVKVTLIRAKGDKVVPLGDPSLNNLPNTGYALISKRSLNGAKIKTGEENKHYFQIEEVGVPTAVIKSGCFTFYPKPERTNKACHGPQKMRECVDDLIQKVAELREDLTALETGGAEADQAVGAQVINKDSGHEHSEYAAESHPHTSISATSHTHEDYVEKDYVTRQIDTMQSFILLTTRQVSALQARLDALEGGGGDSVSGVGQSGGSFTETTGDCRHDKDGLWADGMDWEKCKNVKWNAANGVGVATNPVCWRRDVKWDSGGNPWVVGTPAAYNSDAYGCRTECASAPDLNYCATNGWWNLPAAEKRRCTAYGIDTHLNTIGFNKTFALFGLRINHDGVWLHTNSACK